MEDRTTKTLELEKWYMNFIQAFRNEYENFSEIEKEITNMNFNFLSPCQMEIFWLKEPEFQLVVRSNFKDRPDNEIIINGPYESHEFIDKIESLINQRKWQMEIDDSDEEWIYHHKRKYAEALAREFYALVYYAKEYHFTSNRFKEYGGTRISNIVHTTTFAGNIFDKDYLSEIKNVVESIRQQAKFREDFLRQEREGLLPKPQTYKPQAYGIHFFPPIVIGKKPIFSPNDILRGRWASLQYEKIFDSKINDITIIVEKNGFTVVGTPDKRLAFKMLNTIMAIGVLHGFTFYAVREHELGDAGYNKESLTIGGFSYEQNTLRTELFKDQFWREKLDLEIPEVKEDDIKHIIKKSSIVFKDKKLVEELGIFIEAYTHYMESEYGQSFLMSWIVIERHLFDLWENWWKDKLANGEKIPTLFIDRVLQFLKSNGNISKVEYSLYDDLRTIRNDFIHTGKSIDQEKAKKCFDESMRIIKNKVPM